MTERKQQDERLREFFAVVREAEPPPPGFRATLERATPAPARRWRWAAVAAALLMLVALGAIFRLAPPRPPAVDELELAQTLSGWQAPLDFLLETPGREVLVQAPSVYGGPSAVPFPTVPPTKEAS